MNINEAIKVAKDFKSRDIKNETISFEVIYKHKPYGTMEIENYKGALAINEDLENNNGKRI